MLHVFIQGIASGEDEIDITDRVNLSDRNFSVVCNAEQGSTATSSFVVDDPDGELDTVLLGLARIQAFEDEAPSEHEMVFWGYLTARDVTRLEAPVGIMRGWNLNAVDINSLLSRRVMRGSVDRPEETDVERVQWLMTTGAAGFFDDTITFIDTTAPVDMDAVDYEGQMFNAVLDDASQQSGKNYYSRWLWDTSLYLAAVWYGPDDTASALSDLRISNILGDIDAWIDNTPPSSNATWAASLDSKLNIDPSRVSYGIYANYDGGSTYQFDSTTRDTIVSWPNVKTLTQANARALRYLDTLQVEEEVISTSILVPPFNVNDAMAGDMIDVRFSHFPGYEEFRSMRILNRTVTWVTPEVYQIDYQLTPISSAPPLSCALVGSEMNLLDSGLGGPSTGPYSQVPDEPGEGPAMLVGAYMISEGTGFLVVGAPTLVSPWTLLDSYYDGVGVHSYCGIGYLPWTTGTPATFQIPGSGGSGGDPNYALMTTAFRTAATTPVQHAAQYGTGGSVTFDAPPTPGNIIICYQFTEQTTFSGALPTGFSLVGSAAYSGSNLGLNGVSMTITYRCVEEGDTATYGIPESSFTHHTFMSEWELTE